MAATASQHTQMDPPAYPAPAMPTQHSDLRMPPPSSLGGLSGQRPLPLSAPLTDVARAASSYIRRSDSGTSSRTIGSQDIDMVEAERDAISDNEDTEGEPDPNSTSKKKKSQRFFCTDYPPCQLSFTRSEHLARHIRKHTGERPFQCHCGKRFTRLDNLRQHAQTVHVNEDIPPESLAATGTRFQRQIRTDRVRPIAGRSRGSISGGHSRGHSRNWSESSIGSVSDIASPIDRRPPSLVMTQMSPSAATGLTLDTSITGAPEGFRAPYHESPNGYGTLPSAFSYGPSSPTTYTSPGTVMPRGPSTPNRGDVVSRRLTFPASQAQPMLMGPPSYPPSGPGPALYSPSPSSTGPAYSNNASGYASPTASVFADGGRYANEGDIRRRTWHPSNQYGSRPATSGLSYYQTPDDQGPMTTGQPAATQAIRLPGIDSFLRQSTTGDSNPNRHAHYEAQGRPIEAGRGGHRDSWGSISSGLNHLEINRGQDASPQAATARPVSSSGLPPPGSYQMLSSSAPTHTIAIPPSSYHGNARLNIVDAARGPSAGHSRSHSITDLHTSRNSKRLGWYQGPPSASAADSIVPPASGSPGGSNSSAEGLVTPAATLSGDYAPGIFGGGGYLEQSRPDLPVEDVQKTPNAPPHAYALPPLEIPHAQPAAQDMQPVAAQTNDMHRLDALAAAATSGSRSA